MKTKILSYIRFIICLVHRKIYKLSTFNIAQGTWMGVKKTRVKECTKHQKLTKKQETKT